LALTVKLVACIMQVLLLNLGREPGYPKREFPQFSSFPWLHQRQVMLLYFQIRHSSATLLFDAVKYVTLAVSSKTCNYSTVPAGKFRDFTL